MQMRGFEVISAYIEQSITLPIRKTVSSAGYDIEAAIDVSLLPHKVTIIPTGLKAYMQQQEFLGIYIRSGLSIKHNITLTNSQGIIDADYYNNSNNEGHIMVAVTNHSNDTVTILKGTRIAQGIFHNYLLVDNDTATKKENRIGGFGSTD